MTTTIDPKAITNFDRTQEELEMFWLFCVLVAGKNADWASNKLQDLFKNKKDFQTPFQFLQDHLIDLHNILVANKVGQYKRITKAIEQSINLDLKTATLDEFLSVFGVGPKTARFFILHTRRDAECAVLDTHILKWMRTIVHESINVPTSTPPVKEYDKWEKMVIKMMKVIYKGISLAEADLLIWMKMSGRLNDE
jgi:thermostable 8-oxoguanine DNA glycosylase